MGRRAAQLIGRLRLLQPHWPKPDPVRPTVSILRFDRCHTLAGEYRCQRIPGAARAAVVPTHHRNRTALGSAVGYRYRTVVAPSKCRAVSRLSNDGASGLGALCPAATALPAAGSGWGAAVQ